MDNIGKVYGVNKKIPKNKRDDFNFRKTIVNGISGLASFKFKYMITQNNKTFTGIVTGNVGFTSLDSKVDQERIYLRARDDAKYKAFFKVNKFMNRGGKRNNFNIYEEVLRNTNIELLLEGYKIRYNTKDVNIKTRNYTYNTKKGRVKYRFNIIRDNKTGRIISRSRFRNEKINENVFNDF